MTLGDRPAQGHALRARADGVRRVLDVGAGHVRTAGRGQCDGADAEVAVGAVGGGLGGDGVALEVVQLLDGEAEGRGGVLEVRGVDAGENGGWLGGHCEDGRWGRNALDEGGRKDGSYTFSVTSCFSR